MSNTAIVNYRVVGGVYTLFCLKYMVSFLKPAYLQGVNPYAMMLCGS